MRSSDDLGETIMDRGVQWLPSSVEKVEYVPPAVVDKHLPQGRYL